MKYKRGGRDERQGGTNNKWAGWRGRKERRNKESIKVTWKKRKLKKKKKKTEKKEKRKLEKRRKKKAGRRRKKNCFKNTLEKMKGTCTIAGENSLSNLGAYGLLASLSTRQNRGKEACCVW